MAGLLDFMTGGFNPAGQPPTLTSTGASRGANGGLPGGMSLQELLFGLGVGLLGSRGIGQGIAQGGLLGMQFARQRQNDEVTRQREDRLGRYYDAQIGRMERDARREKEAERAYRGPAGGIEWTGSMDPQRYPLGMDYPGGLLGRIPPDLRPIFASIPPDEGAKLYAGMQQKAQERADQVRLQHGLLGALGYGSPAGGGAGMAPSTGDDYRSRVYGFESGGRMVANATGPNGQPASSAFGPGQMTDAAWRDVMENRPDLGLTMADRADPQRHDAGFQAFTELNRERLKKSLGREPTAPDLYLAHRFGAKGAVDVLRAAARNGETPVPQILGWDAATSAANPDVARLSASEALNLAGQRMQGVRGPGSAPQADPMAPGQGLVGMASVPSAGMMGQGGSQVFGPAGQPLPPGAGGIPQNVRLAQAMAGVPGQFNNMVEQLSKGPNYRERDLPLPDGRLQRQVSQDGGQSWHNLGASWDRRADSGGGISAVQQRENMEIAAARDLLVQRGFTRDEILEASRDYMTTGRVNPNHDPTVLSLMRKAAQRMTGEDPEFDRFFNTAFGGGRFERPQPFGLPGGRTGMEASPELGGRALPVPVNAGPLPASPVEQSAMQPGAPAGRGDVPGTNAPLDPRIYGADPFGALGNAYAMRRQVEARQAQQSAGSIKAAIESGEASEAAILQEARAAIASGADRNAVRSRLMKAGIDPKGL